MGGGLDWRMLIAAVQRGNPGAPPQVLMGAVNKLVPLMNSQSQLEWRHMQGQAAQDRVGATYYGIDTRAKTAVDAIKGRKDVADTNVAGRQKAVETSVGGRADVADKNRTEKAREADQSDTTKRRGQDMTDQARKDRQASTDAHRKITEDQGWQRLNQQRQALEARIKQGGDRQAITQWRAILDAQHKRTTEIIGSYGVVMDEKVRKRMLDESNQAYERAIKEIGGGPTFGDRFQGGGQ